MGICKRKYISLLFVWQILALQIFPNLRYYKRYSQKHLDEYTLSGNRMETWMYRVRFTAYLKNDTISAGGTNVESLTYGLIRINRADDIHP